MLRSFAREFKLVANGLVCKGTRLQSTATASGRLQGKIAVITGGASGLGKAAAHQFIRNGARVIIADINTELGSQAAKDLGPSAHFVQCDVTEEAQVAEVVEAAVGLHGKLDIMYNSAGIVGPVLPPSIADLDLDAFDQVMRINVRGTVAGIKHAARFMIPAGSGSVICTSSMSGLLGGLGPHPYTISKFTIPGIVKFVGSELCRIGVRINCISPGPVPTPLSVGQIAQFYPGVSTEQLAQIVNAMGELKGAKCEEMDVAQAAVYLASDESKYITGHNLVVDGGFTCYKDIKLPSLDQILQS